MAGLVQQSLVAGFGFLTHKSTPSRENLNKDKINLLSFTFSAECCCFFLLVSPLNMWSGSTRQSQPSLTACSTPLLPCPWHARVLAPGESTLEMILFLLSFDLPLLPSLSLKLLERAFSLCRRSPSRSRKVLLYPGLVLRVCGVTTGRSTLLFWGRVQKICHPTFSLLGKPTCG